MIYSLIIAHDLHNIHIHLDLSKYTAGTWISVSAANARGRWIHVYIIDWLPCFHLIENVQVDWYIWSMEVDDLSHAFDVVSPLDANMESIVEYEVNWLDAILLDDVELARHLLDINKNISSIGLTHVVGKTGKTGNYTLLPHTLVKCKLACSTYTPDNVWCLAAIYNSRELLRFLVERQLNATEGTSHGNNYLHCLIAFASMETEEVELQAVDSAKYIQSLLSVNEYEQILMAENQVGLRPLELASHLGMFALFMSIFESSPVYIARNLHHSFYTIQYYDITDYVTGDRFSKSPSYTMMFLEEKTLKHSRIRDVFLEDPMKTWLSALIYSNMPVIILWSLLRMSFMGFFVEALFLSAAIAVDIETVAVTDVFQNQSFNNVQLTRNSSHNSVFKGRLQWLLLYTSIFSFCALSYWTVKYCVTVCRKNRWLFEAVNGKKRIISKAGFYDITHAITLVMVLAVSIVILLKNSGDKMEERLYSYLYTASLTAMFPGVWSILFFLQLVPKINIYIFAIQSMLGKFVGFALVFLFFFLAFSFIFYILESDSYKQTLYKTFELMLNIVHFEIERDILKLLHVTFIFIIVYMLLNIVIAILTSEYHNVIQNGDIISRVQMLSIIGITEPFMTTLFQRLHNWLCQKYLVFEGGKVYVTKVVMKPRHFPLIGMIRYR